MSAQILDGKAISAKIRESIKNEVEKLVKKGLRAPGLVVIQIGNNPASEIYIKNKKKACESVGFISSII